jgi:hypothetical protein
VFNNIQVWFFSPFLYTIIAIHLVINEGMRFCTMENLDHHYHTTFSGWERLPGVFWIKNGRKYLAATWHFLDEKS